MSEIVHILELALQRERYIDDLLAQLPLTPDGFERRKILAKVEVFRAQRHPLFNAWMETQLNQFSDELDGPQRHIPSGAVFDTVLACVDRDDLEGIQLPGPYFNG